MYLVHGTIAPKRADIEIKHFCHDGNVYAEMNYLDVLHSIHQSFMPRYEGEAETNISK